MLRTVLKTLCAGYPRITSGLMLNPKKLSQLHTTIFPVQNNDDEPWLHNENCFKRHFLSFPQFPFRTLHPRNVNTYFPNDQTFNSSSPIFPANTQINIIFKRRKLKNLVNYLLPTNLNYLYGSQKSTLSEDERKTGLSFTVKEPAPAPAVGASAAAIAAAAQAPDVLIEYLITNVEININDIYLQVFIYINTFILKLFFFKIIFI
jgi:hypothetical protein